MLTLDKVFHYYLIGTIWIWDFHVLATPEGHPGHLILSKSTGLVRADVVGTTHDFTGRKSLDKVLVLKHLLDRVGKGNHDSKRKSFRYSDDDNSDSNNNVSKPFFNVLPESSGTLVFGV